MEVHVQEGPDSSEDVPPCYPPENFNDVGWASFPEIDEKEHTQRVSLGKHIICSSY